MTAKLKPLAEAGLHSVQLKRIAKLLEDAFDEDGDLLNSLNSIANSLAEISATLEVEAQRRRRTQPDTE